MKNSKRFCLEKDDLLKRKGRFREGGLDPSGNGFMKNFFLWHPHDLVNILRLQKGKMLIFLLGLSPGFVDFRLFLHYQNPANDFVGHIFTPPFFGFLKIMNV
jgi:hypothetical protein